MNDREDTVIGWPEPLEETETLSLEDLPSKMGGAPIWLSDSPKTLLPSLSCDACGKTLKFLLQIYAPLDSLPQSFHRYLYVFLCENFTQCTNTRQGVYLYRSQLPEDNGVLKYNPDQDTFKRVNPPGDTAVPPENVLTEKQWKIETDMQDAKTQGEVQEEETEENEDDEDEEDTLGFDAKEMKDDAFKLFKKFDEQTPGHILRYTFGKDSRPLYYSDYQQFKHPVTAPCLYCQGPRVFEFQLNVQLLAEVDALKSLDWGIVAFYTCAASCQPKDTPYCREHVEVQEAPEEVDRLNHRRLQERRLKQFQQDMEAETDGPDLTPEEIRAVEAQIKAEDKVDQQTAALLKASKAPTEMADKPAPPPSGPGKKLFEDPSQEDDWS